MRIVRFDGSGTTYNFKAFLSLLPGAPTGLWTEAPVAGDNHNWPETFNGEKKQPSDVNGSTKMCESANDICTALEKGGGPLAEAVAATNGSIGYADTSLPRVSTGSIWKEKRRPHILGSDANGQPGKRQRNWYYIRIRSITEVATSNLSASPEGRTAPTPTTGATQPKARTRPLAIGKSRSPQVRRRRQSRVNRHMPTRCVV